jgi:hypothetical protein
MNERDVAWDHPERAGCTRFMQANVSPLPRLSEGSAPSMEYAQGCSVKDETGKENSIRDSLARHPGID